jgi:hypothetical protein
LLIFHYLCGGLGEKSQVADALAFISHFTEDASETSYGIVRMKKQGKSQRKAIPHYEHQLCTTLWRGSILIS